MHKRGLGKRIQRFILTATAIATLAGGISGCLGGSKPLTDNEIKLMEEAMGVHSKERVEYIIATMNPEMLRNDMIRLINANNKVVQELPKLKAALLSYHKSHWGEFKEEDRDAYFRIKTHHSIISSAFFDGDWQKYTNEQHSLTPIRILFKNPHYQ